MPTYLNAYEDHLTGIIERGGSEATVEAAVTEYNKASPTKLAAWAKGAALICAYCDKLAEVNDSIRPTDEVTCAEHRA